MAKHQSLPLFVSIPHSGEAVPEEAGWLRALPPEVLMRDVDRFVDRLYSPLLSEFGIPSVIADIHRYVVDLNRRENEFDAAAVEGAVDPVGTHPKGLHWSVTTQGEPLIRQPMSAENHEQLLELYYRPFHHEVESMGQSLLQAKGQILHLDLHSMPGRGTQMHPDPGQTRAEVVLSDFHRRSCQPDLCEMVLASLQQAGLEVAYNWPYIGGGITQRYGQPAKGWSTLQIELNRSTYMDEKSQQWVADKADVLQVKLRQAFKEICANLARGGLHG